MLAYLSEAIGIAKRICFGKLLIRKEVGPLSGSPAFGKR